MLGGFFDFLKPSRSINPGPERDAKAWEDVIREQQRRLAELSALPPLERIASDDYVNVATVLDHARTIRECIIELDKRSKP